MRSVQAGLAAFCFVATLGVGPTQAAQSCGGFMDAFQRAAPELKAQFVRPVVVGGTAGNEARDLVTEHSVDARLLCKGERFDRFEARIQTPAEPRLVEAFRAIEEAAAIAALDWKRPRAAQTLRAMSAEAQEYLRASEERGDVFVSGKTERHAGRGGDIGLVWTKTERSFVIAAWSD